MNAPNWVPKAILGDPLAGRHPVYYAYLDEAGTSGAAHETHRVVAGIVIKPDETYQLVEDRLAALINDVPEPCRPGFHLHGKTILNNNSYDDHWPIEQRANFLAKAMRIPRECGGRSYMVW